MLVGDRAGGLAARHAVARAVGGQAAHAAIPARHAADPGLRRIAPGAARYHTPAHRHDDPLAHAQRVRAQVGVRRLQHRDGHLVALRDPGERLTRGDVVVHERHPLVDRQIGVPLGHTRPLAPRHAHDDGALRRCYAAHVLRIQLQERRNRRVGQASQHIQPGRVGNRDLIEDQRGQAFDVGEPVPAGLLGDECRRDQLRHIVTRFPAQVTPVGDLEEGLIVDSVGLTRQAADFPLDPAGTGIVGRGRQIDAPQALHQVLEMIDRGVRRFEGIAPLVHPGVDLQAISPARRRHELPHSHGSGAAHRRIRQPAFDQREIDEILRELAGTQPLADHSLVPPQA